MHNASMQALLSATVALILIIAAGQVCGRLALRLGQPAEVGEMIAGVLLGPTALGYFAPDFCAHIFSPDIKQVLYALSMIGLSLYMFLVGAEHRSPPVAGARKFLPAALGVLGFVLPVGLGCWIAMQVALSFKPDGVASGVFIMFVGVALSVTAFPMLARVLQERHMTRTVFGSIAIKVAAVDDVLAWIALAIIGAVAEHGEGSAAFYRTIIPGVAFVIVSFLVVPRVFGKALERAVKQGQIGDGLFSSLLLLVLCSGFATDYIGLYSVFGGFVAGAALPRTEGFSPLLQLRLLQVLRCFFLPIFFSYAGLNTDLAKSIAPSSLLLILWLLGAAVVGKAGPALFLLRVCRWSWGESIAMAALMNARGLMILIYVTIGLSLGIIGTDMYSVMVLIAICTTALALPVYRLHFSERVEQEARREWGRISGRDVTPEVESRFPASQEIVAEMEAGGKVEIAVSRV